MERRESRQDGSSSRQDGSSRYTAIENDIVPQLVFTKEGLDRWVMEALVIHAEARRDLAEAERELAAAEVRHRTPEVIEVIDRARDPIARHVGFCFCRGRCSAKCTPLLTNFFLFYHGLACCHCTANYGRGWHCGDTLRGEVGVGLRLAVWPWNGGRAHWRCGHSLLRL